MKSDLMKFIVLLPLVLSLVMTGSVYASETGCAAVYLKLMDEIKTGKKVADDPCLRADHYERILNWIGTGEVECADMPKQREEMRRYKETFTEFLWKAVQKCGR